MDCSLQGSSVHMILQARILERVAMPSSKKRLGNNKFPKSHSEELCKLLRGNVHHGVRKIRKTLAKNIICKNFLIDRICGEKKSLRGNFLAFSYICHLNYQAMKPICQNLRKPLHLGLQKYSLLNFLLNFYLCLCFRSLLG